MHNNHGSVLLVADRDAHLHAFRGTLEELGFRVVEAASGREALHLARSAPDLILVDVRLADMDGLELCRSLKSNPKTSHIPLIQSSTFPPPRSQPRALEQPDDYLVQPISDNDLIAAVQAWMRVRGVESELHGTNYLLSETTKALRKNESRLRAALDIAQLGIWEYTAQLGVWQHDVAGAVTRIDARCREVFGISEEVLLSNEEMLALVHPEDRARVEEQLRHGLVKDESGRYEAEYRIVRSDGVERWVAMRGRAVRPDRNADRRLVQFVGTLMDITERKQQEQALIRSEKLAAIGRMSACVAHEINNPLTAVMNTLYLARTNADDPESVRKYLETAEAEVTRISHITRQVLGFYRESAAPARFSVGNLLDSAIELLKSRIKAKGVMVQKQCADHLHLKGMPGELRQVISNLLANSLDAVGENGTIKMRASIAPLSANGNRRLRVTVADNGKGIPRSALPHLFEPFFTTKHAVGTGLGLWISKQIVDDHHGSIRVHSRTSQPHRGTAFLINLPAEPAAVIANARVRKFPGPRRTRNKAASG